MLNFKTEILPILEITANGLSDHYCICSEHGEVFSISPQLLKYTSLPKDLVKSIFQINPQLTFFDWQKLSQEIEINKIIEINSSVIEKLQQIKQCTVKIMIGNLAEQKFIIFAPIVPQQIKPQQAPKEQATKPERNTKLACIPQEQSLISVHPVFLFNSEGQIISSNDLIQDINSNFNQNKLVNSLFLETDGGPVLDVVSNYFQKDIVEVILQLIMKTKSGFLKVIGRTTKVTYDKGEEHYRMEVIMHNKVIQYGEGFHNVLEDNIDINDNIKQANEIIVEHLSEEFVFQDIITKSSKYKEILSSVAQVADTVSTVLITGETGTGKELLASAIYKLSDRSDKIFVKVNCASIPTELVESTLFGHEKGSFTGADKLKIGKFELANGGTIFLDEIGELPLNLQSKLLRALQEGEIERVGNPKPIKLDVRVIAATNRDLEAMAKEGSFRSDLYYRLNVFPIYNIPLRERQEDIEPLIHYFINKSNKKIGKNVQNINKRDLLRLQKYNFPGNIRELENIIERATILSKSNVLDLSFFSTKSSIYDSEENSMNFDETIKSHIIKALIQAKGKVTGSNSACEILAINGKTLASRIKKFNIDPKKYVG